MQEMFVHAKLFYFSILGRLNLKLPNEIVQLVFEDLSQSGMMCQVVICNCQINTRLELLIQSPQLISVSTALLWRSFWRSTDNNIIGSNYSYPNRTLVSNSASKLICILEKLLDIFWSFRTYIGLLRHFSQWYINFDMSRLPCLKICKYSWSWIFVGCTADDAKHQSTKPSKKEICIYLSRNCYTATLKSMKQISAFATRFVMYNKPRSLGSFYVANMITFCHSLSLRRHFTATKNQQRVH